DCNLGVYTAGYTAQDGDGLVDAYRDRVRFAYSSFDSVEGSANDGSTFLATPDWSYPGTSNPSAADGFVVKVAGSTLSSCATACRNEACQLYTGTYSRYYCVGNV